MNALNDSGRSNVPARNAQRVLRTLQSARVMVILTAISVGASAIAAVLVLTGNAAGGVAHV